ncbi:hypothetical protein FRC04_004619 [Tulasnella sp. 424]|nr:hypothetical protein FRC04_004619 [Tulasnella sp. 424]
MVLNQPDIDDIGQRQDGRRQTLIVAPAALLDQKDEIETKALDLTGAALGEGAGGRIRRLGVGEILGPFQLWASFKYPTIPATAIAVSRNDYLEM